MYKSEKKRERGKVCVCCKVIRHDRNENRKRSLKRERERGVNEKKCKRIIFFCAYFQTNWERERDRTNTHTYIHTVEKKKIFVVKFFLFLPSIYLSISSFDLRFCSLSLLRFSIWLLLTNFFSPFFFVFSCNYCFFFGLLSWYGFSCRACMVFGFRVTTTQTQAHLHTHTHTHIHTVSSMISRGRR